MPRGTTYKYNHDQILTLLNEGKGYDEISELIDIPRVTLYAWAQRNIKRSKCTNCNGSGYRYG